MHNFQNITDRQFLSRTNT